MFFNKLYHPEIFQGNLNSKGYFEGWYFKQVTSDLSRVISVIPGISLTDDSHCFIQVIDAQTGASHYIDFPVDRFHASDKRMDIRIDSNHFSANGMELDINRDGIQLKGKLHFSGKIGWPSRLLAPGIMGWYSFVPKMECYHGVASLYHEISGTLEYNSERINLDQGRGYIEKDWGTSMPESWIWLHANTFSEKTTSLMLSIAKIPWRGSWFTGYLCFFYLDGNLFRFMTYNRSKMRNVSIEDKSFEVDFYNPRYTIRISAAQKKLSKLKAPVNGLMDRFIKESVDSEVTVELTNKKGEIIYTGSAEKAGIEMVGESGKLVPG